MIRQFSCVWAPCCWRDVAGDALAGIAQAVMVEGLGTRPDTVANHVSGAANGVDERTVEALVDLRSQPRDMHVNNVGLRVPNENRRQAGRGGCPTCRRIPLMGSLCSR